MKATAPSLRLASIAAPKVIYFVLFILLIITFADLKDREKTFDSADTRILQDIFENVNQQPINGIYIAYGTTYQPCNLPGYEPVSLGSWDGTIQGCLCGSTLNAGFCPSPNCSSISAQNSTRFNTYDGHQFCVSRTSNWMNPSKSGACDSGYLLCDSSNICVRNGDGCPITDLLYISTSEIPADYYSIFTNGSYNLVYTHKARNAAITSLKVSLYDRPCLDPKAMPFTPNGESYILSKVPENGCGGTGMVEHLEVIANKSAYYFLLENNMNEIFRALPDFWSFVNRQQAFLVGERQYLTINNSGSCPKVSTSYLTKCKSLENSFVNNVNGVLIAGLVFGSIIFFLTIIELTFLVRKKEGKWAKSISIVNLLMIWILYALCIIIGGIAVDKRQKMSSDVDALNDLASHQCFRQEIVNRILQNFQRNIEDFDDILWLCICQLIVAFVGVLIAILIGLMNIRCGKRCGEFFSCFKNVGNWFKRKVRGTGVQGGAATPAYIEMLISNKSVVR